MATLSWCVLVLAVIACQVHDAASALTVTSEPATVSIKENIAVGTTVVTVSSSDSDVVFTLESQEPVTDPKIFAIGGSSGVVTVADKTHLDFQTATYTLVFKATQNTAGSPDSGTVTVTVTVTDKNAAPTFAEARYTACVSKGSTGGTDVTQVTATDEDVGDKLTYSLTDSSIFTVGGSDGTIEVANGQTIGETPTSYSLTITATDDDEAPASGTTTVSINVEDPCQVTTPAPVTTSAPATTPPTGDITTLPGVTLAPNFGTTISASFLCDSG